MSRLTDRLERDLHEVAAGAHPSPSAWESIVARLDDLAGPEAELMLASTTGRSKRPVWVAVAAALLVVTGSIVVSTRPGDDRSTTTADMGLTTTFVSPRNGFTMTYPDKGAGTVTPSKQLWGFSRRIDDGFDLVETGSAAVFKGASTELSERPQRNSVDPQVDEYLSGDYVVSGGCGIPRSQQAEITIDGQPARIAECPKHIEATVVVGGRLYLFSLSHDRSDARAVFNAIVDTIDLTPETAVDFPAMTTTFVSPTYGYSFKYHDRGGLAPATEVWDPVNQQFDVDFDNRFDAVETGLNNYFEGASTEIPDGVSIDEWVDQYLAPGSCGVPRSQQAEITIDGQPARIAECPDRIVATVAAGGRLYLFTGGLARRDSRAWFDAWIATIALTPKTATVP